MSEDNEHDTGFVYEVQTQIVNYLKEYHPNISKILYFSDGCAAQYKNHKNLYNICLHKDDFDIDAEWTFFATSHGKSPCDGIGGTVKRLTANASLQRPINDQILNCNKMFDFYKQY